MQMSAISSPAATTRPRRAHLPTLTQLQYRLASGRTTSVDLTTRSLRAIEASQSTLNAFRVVMTEQALSLIHI